MFYDNDILKYLEGLICGCPALTLSEVISHLGEQVLGTFHLGTDAGVLVREKLVKLVSPMKELFPLLTKAS